MDGLWCQKSALLPVNLLDAERLRAFFMLMQVSRTMLLSTTWPEQQTYISSYFCILDREVQSLTRAIASDWQSST